MFKIVNILQKNWFPATYVYPISHEKPNFSVIWSFIGNYVKSEKPSSVLLSSLSQSLRTLLPLRILHQWDAQIESLWQEAQATESSYPLILQIQCYYIYVRLLHTECIIKKCDYMGSHYKSQFPMTVSLKHYTFSIRTAKFQKYFFLIKQIFKWNTL